MEELRNCPCCGSRAKIMTDKETFEFLVAKNGYACVSIECEDGHGCGMSMYCHYESNNYEVMVAVAIDRWNRRVSNG